MLGHDCSLPICRLPSSSIPRPLHVARHGLLGTGQCLLCRRRAGKRSREELPDLGAEPLELRDRHELHPDIGDWLDGRFGRIGRVDRLERQLGEGRSLLILRIVVERLAGAGRHMGPPFLGRHQLGIACSSPSR